jgi:uncharacterized protein involved in exopolysaccharide biosynthesis
LIGISLGWALVLITPPKYEVAALLRAAQIKGSEGGSQVINLEDPSVLIFKAKLPATYGPEEFSACGTLGKPDPGNALIDAIKLATYKGSNSIMELRIVGATLDQATSCFNAVFNLLKKDQLKLIGLRKKLTQDRLTYYRSELKEAKRSIQSSSKLETLQLAVYYSTRDDLKFFRAQINRLEDDLESFKYSGATLITPLDGLGSPIYPKVKLILLISLSIGLFVGGCFSYFWGTKPKLNE